MIIAEAVYFPCNYTFWFIATIILYIINDIRYGLSTEIFTAFFSDELICDSWALNTDLR